NDKIDAHKIAVLLRGGMFPLASVYPAAMRVTCDLLRRRCHLGRKQAELLAHIQNTTSQDNLPETGKKLADKANRRVEWETAGHLGEGDWQRAFTLGLCGIGRPLLTPQPTRQSVLSEIGT